MMSQPDLQKLLQQKMSRKEFLALSAVAAASAVGITGLIRELQSHASTPATSLEPEHGTVSGAAVVSDATANGGHAVEFKNSTNEVAALGYAINTSNNEAEFKRIKPFFPQIAYHRVYVGSTPASFASVADAANDASPLGVHTIISIDSPGSGAAARTALANFAASCPAGTIIALSNEPDNNQYTGPAFVAMVNEMAPVAKAAAPAGVRIASGPLMRGTLQTNPGYFSGLNMANIDIFAFHAYAHSLYQGASKSGWPYTYAVLAGECVTAIRNAGWTGTIMCDEFAVEYDPGRDRYGSAGTTATIDRAQWTYDAMKWGYQQGLTVMCYWQHPYDPSRNSQYAWALADQDLQNLSAIVAAQG